MQCQKCKTSDLSSFFTEISYKPGVDYRYWYRTHPVCKACFGKYYKVCSICREHFEKATNPGYNVCLKCIKKCKPCSSCGKLFLPKSGRKRNGVFLCMACNNIAFVKLGGQPDGVQLDNSDIVEAYDVKGPPCQQHSCMVDLVRANAIGIKDGQPHPIKVYFCITCQHYYINQSQFRSFSGKYDMPRIQLRFSNYKPTGSRIAQWNKQSALNFLDYNVGNGNGLTDQQRQKLLADCINADYLTKGDIINHLRGMIALHENQKNQANACSKWERDLSFVQKK